MVGTSSKNTASYNDTVLHAHATDYAKTLFTTITAADPRELAVVV